MNGLYGFEIEPEVRTCGWTGSATPTSSAWTKWRDCRRNSALNWEARDRYVRKEGVVVGQHSQWAPSAGGTDDPERIAIREALAFGKALYDRRSELGWSAAQLAERAGMEQDDIECIEEGGAEPTLELLRILARALDSDVRLTASPEPGSLWFEARAA